MADGAEPQASAAASESTKGATPAEGEAAEPALPRRVVLELNPIAIGIGRYSVQAQFLLAGHHALVVNPYFAYTTATVTFGDAESKEKFAGGGLELGYRFYSNPRKPAGFFVGPSIIGGVFHASSGDSANGGSGMTFGSVGGAIDLGGQALIANRVAIGGGFGLQYTHATKELGDLPLMTAALVGGGIRPRFLFSVGVAF